MNVLRITAAIGRALKWLARALDPTRCPAGDPACTPDTCDCWRQMR